MTLREQEDALFERWQRERNYAVFARDGAVDEVAYTNAALKVVFVLKETNDFDGDLRDFLPTGEYRPTWDVVARWAIALGQLSLHVRWEELRSLEHAQRHSALRGIVAMNLKKVPGAGSTDGAILMSAARADAEYLRGQYALYAPKVTICCGSSTAAAFRAAVLEGAKPDRTSSRGLSYSEHAGTFVVDYVHPQIHGVPHSIVHYGLIDPLREICA